MYQLYQQVGPHFYYVDDVTPAELLAWVLHRTQNNQSYSDFWYRKMSGQEPLAFYRVKHYNDMKNILS